MEHHSPIIEEIKMVFFQYDGTSHKYYRSTNTLVDYFS